MQKEREGIPIFSAFPLESNDSNQWLKKYIVLIHMSHQHTQQILQSTYKKKSSNTSKSSLITLQKLNLVSDTSFGLVQGQFAHSRCTSFFFWLFLFLEKILSIVMGPKTTHIYKHAGDSPTLFARK